MTISNMEQARRDTEHGVYDFTDNGKCTQCGQCCSNVLPLTQEEIKTISHYIKRYNIKPFKRLFPMKQIHDMTCPFLDISKDKEKCRIYEVRPQICRDFICNPQKRKPPNLDDYKDFRIVFMREEFFKE